MGHLSSTQTKIAMPHYLRSASPPVPMLLSAETNPELFQPGRTEAGEGGADNDLPVFRFMPTDERQASDAAAFAISGGANNFWVVEDSTNPVYSKYLVIEFVRSVQQQKKSVLLSTNNTTIPSVDSIKAFKPDCVFFAGSPTNALILIRQVRALSKSAGVPAPTIILSDSAVDKTLVDQGGADVEGVYAVYPMSADEYNDPNTEFKALGRDARAVLDVLLEETSRRFIQLNRQHSGLGYWAKWVLRIHRVSDARWALGQVMIRSMRERTPFQLTGGRRAVFAEGFRNETARFRIWRVQNRRFDNVR